MPEQPPAKRPTQPLPNRRSDRTIRYAELHCRTNFSLLEGTSHPDELVQQAAALGYEALAITDRNSLAGVVRAHVAAKEAGLKLLIGAEVTPNDTPPVLLFASDRASYGRLTRLLTVGRRRAAKGECELTFDDIAEYHAGLIACVCLPTQYSVLSTQHSVPCARDSTLNTALPGFRNLFADRCYLLAELHRGPNDQRQLERAIELSHVTSVPLVAANDVHYHIRQRSQLQDIVTAIRHGCTVAELGHRRFPNSERYLKPPDQMAELFAAYPEAFHRTIEIAERCHFSLDELRYEYPEELAPAGITSLQYLEQLTWEGAKQRYPKGIPDEVRKLIEHELQLIKELRYEAYFLTVWDLVRFAREKGREILCQGRGSAANSAVCYCLGITSVNPERINVLFERFVSKERDEAPDIDVDFEHERREEVLQYIYAKYGRERAGIAATVISYRPRSAVRDVGKALGLSLDRVDTIAKAIEKYGDVKDLEHRLQDAGLDPSSRISRQLIDLSMEILSFPRHLSQHVGGMVMTKGPLCEMVVIENAAMPRRTVVQWDKDDLAALGILKVDCLSLGMLTAIRKCFELIEKHCGQSYTLASIPQDDPNVYEMVQRADTVGVFQIESRAQMSMLPRLRPENYYDLVIEVSIVRPGPIQGNMVHPYLRRREGKDKVSYPSEEVKAVLERTLGVPIFQEQAMQLAVVAAGFTPGEADQLRRAMGAWRRRGLIDGFQQKLIRGMLDRGYSMEFAEQLFNQIRGFGEYGFPESHAASFALLVYVSSWMKHYYPAAFTASILNSLPMGFYAPAQLIADVRKHDVEVFPVDVNFSHWDCTLEGLRIADCGMRNEETNPKSAIRNPQSLRLGFRILDGLSQTHAETIVRGRGDGPFTSFDDFCHRTKLSSAILKRLSKADAFRSLNMPRREALWQSLPEQTQLPLFDNIDPGEPEVDLPAMSLQQEVVADYQSAHLSLRGHPMQFVRDKLDELQVMCAERLPNLAADRRYKVAGLVLARQRPSTAKGVTFVTLEDETGIVNLIVRQEVWKRYYRTAQRATAMLVHGRLQREREVIHILADRLEDLSPTLAEVKSKSRDFR
ncbi:MAG: error-prone DNA polymerase [Planctomycetaceae bacterium]|nr:error-prone DNA polymerase [Planctomycetaceae bacterium]